MKNLLETFKSKLKTPLMGLGYGEEQIAALVTKNIKQPMTAARASRMYGGADEFMSKYANFENLYLKALDEELLSTHISAGQRRMLAAAKGSPSINLNLISNYNTRKSLVSQLKGTGLLNVEGLIKNFGAPGVPLPSSNIYRASGRYMVDFRDTTRHPILSLVNSLTFNIDPKKGGADAFSFGVSNLPSSSALKSMYENGRNVRVID